VSSSVYFTWENSEHRCWTQET